MSIEKPQNGKEDRDEINLFKEKVRDLVQKERVNKKTAHFDQINATDIGEFVGSLNQDDMKWFRFTEELGTVDVVLLKSEQVKEYKEKLLEFKEFKKECDGSTESFRSIWCEFLANKLNAFSFKLQMFEMRSGKKRISPSVRAQKEE